MLILHVNYVYGNQLIQYRFLIKIYKSVVQPFSYVHLEDQTIKTYNNICIIYRQAKNHNVFMDTPMKLPLNITFKQTKNTYTNQPLLNHFG